MTPPCVILEPKFIYIVCTYIVALSCTMLKGFVLHGGRVNGDLICFKEKLRMNQDREKFLLFPRILSGKQEKQQQREIQLHTVQAGIRSIGYILFFPGL